MFDFEIRKFFRRCTHFIGVFPRDKLPKKIQKRPCGLIINTDKYGQPGKHWVAAIFLKNGKGEYFDSFGFPPMEKEITFFMNSQAPGGWFYTSTPVQHPFSISCGVFATSFLLHRFNNISYRNFICKFSYNLQKNEKILRNVIKIKHVF